MEAELKTLEAIIEELREECSTALAVYDKFGHYAKASDKTLEKDCPLRATPPIFDHKCGGIAGADAPK
eukprot:4063272-Ditylum_brightwellii.AAC.1